MSNYETLMLTLQRDATYMSTWIAVFVPVFLLSLCACALMWRLSPHRDNPDLRFVGTIAKVMGRLYFLGASVLMIIIITAPVCLKGRIALAFFSIWFPVVSIIGILVLFWTDYQLKPKEGQEHE